MRLPGCTNWQTTAYITLPYPKELAFDWDDRLDRLDRRPLAVCGKYKAICPGYGVVLESLGACALELRLGDHGGEAPSKTVLVVYA